MRNEGDDDDDKEPVNSIASMNEWVVNGLLRLLYPPSCSPLPLEIINGPA